MAKEDKKRGRPKKVINKGGRPPKIKEGDDEFSNAVIAKLKDVLLNNLPIKDACIEAGISEDTFKRHYDKNKGFADKIDYWRGNHKRLALRNVTNRLEAGDIELSKWTLERLHNDYQTKQKQEISGNIGLSPITININPVKSNNGL